MIAKQKYLINKYKIIKTQHVNKIWRMPKGQHHYIMNIHDVTGLCHVVISPLYVS